MASTRSLSALTALIAVFSLPSSPSSAQDLARGEQIFQLCLACHGEDGAGDPTLAAPPSPDSTPGTSKGS